MMIRAALNNANEIFTIMNRETEMDGYLLLNVVAVPKRMKDSTRTLALILSMAYGLNEEKNYSRFASTVGAER